MSLVTPTDNIGEAIFPPTRGSYSIVGLLLESNFSGNIHPSTRVSMVGPRVFVHDDGLPAYAMLLS